MAGFGWAVLPFSGRFRWGYPRFIEAVGGKASKHWGRAEF